MINTWILLNYFYRKITDEIRIKERKQAEGKLKKKSPKDTSPDDFSFFNAMTLILYSILSTSCLAPVDKDLAGQHDIVNYD